LKNGAGGVHEQLWQKMPVETNREINELSSRSCRAAAPACPFERKLDGSLPAAAPARVDYPANVGENDAALPFDPE
jgi:hypothetical protein